MSATRSSYRTQRSGDSGHPYRRRGFVDSEVPLVEWTNDNEVLHLNPPPQVAVPMLVAPHTGFAQGADEAGDNEDLRYLFIVVFANLLFATIRFVVTHILIERVQVGMNFAAE